MTCKYCGSSVTVSAQPYYQQVAGDVVENHQAIQQRTCYAAGIYVKDEWVVPNVSGTVVATLNDVSALVIGSYLYNPTYGYFLITSWDRNTGRVTLENDGMQGNITPGSLVGAYTLFVATAKPCCADDTSTFFPFVADNFIAPAVSATLTINVTSVFGLRVDDLVRIGPAVYRLDSVISSKQIVIENEGSGFTPGTIVYAKDSNGDYQYLLTYEATFVCNVSDTVALGRIVVCDGGDQKVLSGATVGHVLTLVDDATGEAEYASVGSLVLADGSVTTPKLAAAAVTTAKITDLNVTGAKIADAAVGSLKIADGAVVSTKIADGNVSTAKIADGAVTTAKHADASVTTNKLADASVTTAKIADLNVTTAKINTSAVSTSKIADSNVTTAKIADANVTSAKIADANVITDKIADLNVTTAKLAAEAVTTAKIADANVTTAKLADENVTTAKIATSAITKDLMGPVTGPFSYTPSISTDTGALGLTATGYYFYVGNMVLYNVSFSGTSDRYFQYIFGSAPTAGQNAGSTQTWPAMKAAALDPNNHQVQIYSRWSIGGTTDANVFVEFLNPILGAFGFSVWGMYPWK